MTPNYPQAAPLRDSAFIAEFEGIDQMLRRLGLECGAMEVQYPTLIHRHLLEQAEYPQAFPHLLMGACSCQDPQVTNKSLFEAPNLRSPDWYLSPAVCYHVYAERADQRLSRPQIVTARGHCYRHEAEFQEGRRQLEFEMREIVFIGPASWIEEQFPPMVSKINDLVSSHHLETKWVNAEDPFFLPTAKGKALMQRLMETKKELVWGETKPLALASINRHQTFFGEKFNLRLPDDTFAHTACVAFGLDRWKTAIDASQTKRSLILEDKILVRLRQYLPKLASDFQPAIPLAQLGLDSVDLVEIFVGLDSDFGVRVTIDEFKRLVTVDDLIRLVAIKTPKTV
jgi:acyl carrier protein/seryl-tRNA synthetase